MSAVLKTNFLDRLEQISVTNNRYKDVIESMVTSESQFCHQYKGMMDDFSCQESSLYLFSKSSLDNISIYQEKVKNIREILNSDKIQIVFIGGVSSGKSKIINSIIEEEIFQCSVGKTTTEIVKLSASMDKISYLKCSNKNHLSFDSREALKSQVKELSTTLGKHCIESNEPLEVVLSNPKGSVLNERVILIDTPGYDSSDNAKSRILDISMVADIIVFVMTYIFNEEEKLMFETLSKKTSNLNIFILINKWDDSDSDITDVTEKSKTCIENNLLKWLEKTNELDKNTSKNKYFFISAKERLDNTINKERPEQSILDNNGKFRNEEFNRFVHQLQNCIDHPEVTKYKKHEKTIKKMETEVNTCIRNSVQILKETIGKRQESQTLCETFVVRFKDNDERIKESLNMEKKKRLDHLQSIIDKSNSWLDWRNYLSRKNPHDDEIFQFEELTTKFDEELNDLEESAERFLKGIILYSITNESNDIRKITKETQSKLPQVKPQKSGSKSKIVDSNTKKESQPTGNPATTQIKDERLSESNYLEKEIEDAFQQFDNTVSDRYNGFMDKFRILQESLTKSTSHLEEKHQMLLELK